MEREDGVEEQLEEGYAEEVDEGEEGEDGDEEEDEEGEEGEDDMECGLRFEGDINPLDLIKNTSSSVQLYQQLQQLEYEAFPGRKRKALASCNRGEGSAKKARSEEICRDTFEELLESMTRRPKKAKKRGRRKGSKKKLSPEITKMLGNANLLYADGRYEEAIRVLKEVVLLAPTLPDSYHTLGLVYDCMGDKNKAMCLFMISATLGPKESPLWKLLLKWSIEQGADGITWHCLRKAIRADPADISLRYDHASLLFKKGEYQKAAESYYRIVQICPDDIEALRTATTSYKKCGQAERAISILEEYLKDHPPEADLTVVDMLASLYMESNEHLKALEHIEHSKKGYSGEFPSYLTIREGICHAHVGDMERAEICFSVLLKENAKPRMGLIMAAANSLMSLQQYESALKYYLILEDCSSNNELVPVKIARCYLALKQTAAAIQFLYRALQAREDDIDTRLNLASLLLEEHREDEALALLSPPPNPVSLNETDAERSEPWWLNVKIKLKISHIYRSKGMIETFVEVIYPIVYESLTIDPQKVKRRKKLTTSELLERIRKVGEPQADSIFCNLRGPTSKYDSLSANRAKKLLKERTEQKSAAQAAGFDLESDDSDDVAPQQPLKEPPLHDLFKDEEHFNLISDLCKALTSLQRYDEALEIVSLTLAYKTLPADKKEKFWFLGAQISLNVSDPSDGFDYVRYVVQQRPQSIHAWNCYYRLVLRLENRLSKHNKFLIIMRREHEDLVPPMLIYGNQFTMISQHQAAAKEYLEAYKQMPECPLINLCVGTALVNLALGHRLQNKHQCVAQGLAFLYNNLRLSDNSQEALYNIARAFHHIGLVSLAASYYEKVLTTPQEDCSLPELVKDGKGPTKQPKPGYCNLRREAAYNLHLIYKRSGAVDLARQVLRDYCTL